MDPVNSTKISCPELNDEDDIAEQCMYWMEVSTEAALHLYEPQGCQVLVNEKNARLF